MEDGETFSSVVEPLSSLSETMSQKMKSGEKLDVKMRENKKNKRGIWEGKWGIWLSICVHVWKYDEFNHNTLMNTL